MSTIRRSTDFGTVYLHAALVVSFAVLVATGLRIATDDPDSEWLRILDPVLPVEHLWFRHMVAGVALMAILAAYACYVRGARLQSRVRLDKARALVMTRSGRQRWAAVNVAVFWVLMIALAVEVATGLLVFAGASQSLIAVHRVATYFCLGSIMAHVLLHAASGGIAQLTRVLRPAPLHVASPPQDLAEILAEHLARQAQDRGDAAIEQPREAVNAGAKPDTRRQAATMHAHPFATALAVALLVAGGAIGTEQATRPALRVAQISRVQAPVLDGDLSDPAWTKTAPVSVLTTQGGDFGGTHQSQVEVRAVHDGEFAYFAFVWEDPTRSLKHLPLVKRNGRWGVAATREDLVDEHRFHEDKFSVLLAKPALPLLGAAIHLARKPLADRPASSSGRGLHYIDGDGIADVWQWRASHGGTTGHVDNSHFGSPKPAVNAPYQGGYALDPGKVPYRTNIVEAVSAAGAPAAVPDRLPRDLAAMAQAMGRVSDASAASESEGARWWMLESESVPYTAARDAAVPDGTVMPGIVVADAFEVPHDGIRGVARWAAGRWTLEIARRLYTDSRHDVAIKSGTLMWVAAFDHSQKRHTRHLRPFTLEVD
jgi:hypothetical protein